MFKYTLYNDKDQKRKYIHLCRNIYIYIYQKIIHNKKRQLLPFDMQNTIHNQNVYKITRKIRYMIKYIG